jgi:hypothetical protein
MGEGVDGHERSRVGVTGVCEVAGLRAAQTLH